MDLMRHSSTFLLPTIPTDGQSYALVVLNQRLPRFTPLLWKHCTSLLPRYLNCFSPYLTSVFGDLGFFFFVFSYSEDCFVFLRGTARIRLCADGGANRLYDEMPQLLSSEDPSDVRSRFCVSFFPCLCCSEPAMCVLQLWYRCYVLWLLFSESFIRYY